MASRARGPPPARLALLACVAACSVDVACSAPCGIYGYAGDHSTPNKCSDRGARCCEDVALINQRIADDFKQYAAREDIPEALVALLTSGQPVQEVEDQAFSPVNVEVVNETPMLVTVDLGVLHLSNVNQKAQTFDMQYQLTWRWRDCRLQSKCRLVDLSRANPSFNKFWRPGYLIEERLDDQTDMALMRMFVSGDGLVTLTEDRQSTFRCAFDFREMPYDRQTCNLTWRLPGTPASSIRLDMHEINATGLTNVEWTISDEREWTIHTYKQTFAFPWDHEESIVQARFTIQRLSRYQVTMYVFPCVVFYGMSWLGLWVDPAAVPARAAIGIIPLLTVTNMLIAFAQAVPPISYSTRMQSFMLCTLGFVGMHMAGYAVVHMALRMRAKRAVKMKDEEAHSNEVVIHGEGTQGTANLYSISCFASKLADFFGNWAEPAMRLLSPVLFSLSSILILYA